MSEVQVRGERLELLPAKALWWPRARVLIIADMHMGKATHFRKAGIAVPGAVEQRNVQRAQALLAHYAPHEVLLLGDLFHSRHNGSWEAFVALRRAHSATHFTLVTGNHDILHPDRYAEAGVHCEAQRVQGPFLFTHHPTSTAVHYNIAGHVHPGVRIRGAARQSIVLPCFLFGEAGALLPAFGAFTGLHVLRPAEGERVFAVAGKRVHPYI